MERKENLWGKELWTQTEVAWYFRVVPGTVKNWRKLGLLSYWQAPGSPRILYFREEILNFVKTNSVMKGGGNFTAGRSLNKEKPVISNKLQDEDWRI